MVNFGYIQQLVKNTGESRKNRTHCAFDPETLNDTPPAVKKNG